MIIVRACSIVSGFFATHRASGSWDFPGKNTRKGYPSPDPGDLPDPGAEPVPPVSPALVGDSHPLSHLGSP